MVKRFLRFTTSKTNFNCHEYLSENHKSKILDRKSYSSSFDVWKKSHYSNSYYDFLKYFFSAYSPQYQWILNNSKFICPEKWSGQKKISNELSSNKDFKFCLCEVEDEFL